MNAATAFLLELFIDAPVTSMPQRVRSRLSRAGLSTLTGAHVADTVERLLDVGLIERA